MKVKSPFVHRTLAGITIILVLAALSMTWPVIMTLFVGIFLLLQSCSAEQTVTTLF